MSGSTHDHPLLVHEEEGRGALVTEVRLAHRAVLVDGVPRLLAAGEIHYFRLRREVWRARLEQLRDAGADAVATYVPWVVHERGDGTIDVTGATDPTLDVGGFCDLAAELGLLVVLRPGPFVMAEMAGEGVPDRVRREHPEIQPVGWGDRPGGSADVDVLAPAFVDEAARWYRALGEVVAPRMAPRGGPVVAVQLDNEVGMLAWVTNTPQLTVSACAALADWLGARYGEGLAARYPGLPGGEGFAAAIRTPEAAWVRPLRLDLGRFFRDRFAGYTAALERLATEAGMGGVPFLVNVHGTSAGSGASFPIGLSQLVAAFSGRAQVAAGSDHYLGDLTLATASDLHLINAFMTAASGPEQPGTSLELEAGTADYGDDLAGETDPSAVVLKVRLSLAQGHRLLNQYLFAGGTNFVADPPRTDGTTRFGITGERHGFAAPIGPEGRPGRSLPGSVEAMRLPRRLEPWLADGAEERDDLALGMVLDHYLTEYRPPGVPAEADAIGDLERSRGNGPRALLGRVLLTLGYRYGAVDLQRDGERLPRLVVLGSPGATDAAVQERLAAHVRDGGSLLLLGGLPTTELDGTPCTVLADALGVRVTGVEQDRPGWFTSVQPARGWGHGTERRVGFAQLYEPSGGAARVETVLAEAMTGRACGVAVRDVGPGAGSAVVIGCDLGADLGFFARALKGLGVAPGLAREPEPGLVATTTRAADGSRLLHALNVSPVPLTSTFVLDDVPLLDGVALTLPPRTGVALPVGVRVGAHVLAATAEVAQVGDDVVVLADAVAGPRRAWLDGVEVPVGPEGHVAL